MSRLDTYDVRARHLSHRLQDIYAKTIRNVEKGERTRPPEMDRESDELDDVALRQVETHLIISPSLLGWCWYSWLGFRHPFATIWLSRRSGLARLSSHLQI